jgi:hypothetical protein
MTGKTNFYLPPGATVHGIIVRQLAMVKDNALVGEVVNVHYSCGNARGTANPSFFEALVCPARVNVTPPGLTPGGNTLSYIWRLYEVGADVQTEVEVWLCGATCR